MQARAPSISKLAAHLQPRFMSSQFVHASMECVELPYAVQHVARFLPSVRESGVPFAFIINLVIPGNPLLGIIAMFATEQVGLCLDGQ